MGNAEHIGKLLMRVALKDRTAFAELYDATSAKLFGVCLRILKDRSEAEDALQDVFVRIWQKADRYSRTRLSPISWLCVLARNVAIDRLRRRKAMHESIDEASELPDSDRSPEDYAVLSSEGDRLQACLSEIEKERAEAVVKAYVEGASYQELADHYGVPLNTMRTWLRRSLMKIRQCLTR